MMMLFVSCRRKPWLPPESAAICVARISTARDDISNDVAHHGAELAIKTRCCPLTTSRVLLQDSYRSVRDCHAHLVMKKAAVQTNPAKTTTGQVSSSSARQAKMAKPVANHAAPDQPSSSAKRAKSAKPAAIPDQPYSPPCTRSQQQRFEKQSALQGTFTEQRQGSRQGTSRPVLADSGNKLPPKKHGAPAKAAASSRRQ
ncbi:hypothetical protein MRX96_039778 [Rhipicephalus microplus]